MTGARAVPEVFPRTVAVIGLGLIGGSLALRFRAEGARVLGTDLDPAAVVLARRRGAIDEGGDDLSIAGTADLVIVATPLEQIVPVGLAVSRHMRPGAILTDVGSVKAPIVSAMTASRAGVSFVGGHPMAGTEGSGMQAADGALLEGRPFLLTPTARSSSDAVAALQEGIRRIGMHPIVLDPVQHDELVAQVSHLPYLLSLALRRATADDARAIAGPGFEDMTRVARS
ncbi:MAG: prephenate dehydrogenase/arogenate dehydrogenase family protein, partial [Gemmatimonadetes bacterium]|nr:prephenate dehydrogenase/arogenate dehydrogenase family protein [Gemmatimonadota bacterium]